MKLHLEFTNIVDLPKCKIFVNDQELYSGNVCPSYDFDIAIAEGPASIRIVHWDNTPQDTIVENGIIIHDRSFELVKLVIDDYDLEELIWLSEFRATDGTIYPSCLFFGPNGDFVLESTLPVLPWILGTRHATNNNDPDWEQDYNYYITACKILQQISIK